MNKLFLLVVLITSMAKAQSFDFSCERQLTGQITITGSPLFFTVEDPNHELLALIGTNSFDLTIAGMYLLTISAFSDTITKTININENGNQTLLWSRI